jgi:hypothetical protein
MEATVGDASELQSLRSEDEQTQRSKEDTIVTENEDQFSALGTKAPFFKIPNISILAILENV